MSHLAVDTRWKQRPDLPIPARQFRYAKRLSNDAFLVMPKGRLYKQDTPIFKFESHDNKFTKIMNYDYDLSHDARHWSATKPDYISCSIQSDDPDNPKICVISWYNEKFIILQGNMEPHIEDAKNLEISIVRPGAAFVLIDKILHVIGGEKHNDHLTYDTLGGEIIKQHTFDEYKILQHSQALHIPSKKCILLIGGDAGKHKNQWQRLGIWKYHLINREWTKINVSPEFNFSEVHCALTCHERNIIITPYGLRGNIMILNIENDDKFTFRETNIPLPHTVPHDIVYVGIDSAELIVFGFCRRIFFSFDNVDDCESTRALPIYLIKQFVEWFASDTTLHWVARRDCNCLCKHNHYSITLNEILNG